jgi:hypothetical protein
MAGELVRKRTAARGWLTRTENALKTTIEASQRGEKLSRIVLKDQMDGFDKQLEKMDEVQTDIEISIVDETQLLEEVNTAADYREQKLITCWGAKLCD